MSLKQLAIEIRSLIAAGQDVEVALAIRLAKAKELVETYRETNHTWPKWCQQNVLKRDGKPYAMATIENLVRIGKSPKAQERMDAVRRTVTNYQNRRIVKGVSFGQSRRAAIIAPPQETIDRVLALRDEKKPMREIGEVVGMSKSSVYQILHGKTKSKEFYLQRAGVEELQGQLQTLVKMYENLPPEYQRQFLHAINARPIDTRNGADG